MEKSKFDEYTESIYKIIEVPDSEAGSDSAGPVVKTSPMGDLFTQSVDRIIASLNAKSDSENFDNAESEEAVEGEESEVNGVEETEEHSEEDEVEISHAVDGIKINSHGIEFTLSGVIVNKILAMFNAGPNSETESEEGETSEEEAEESETENETESIDDIISTDSEEKESDEDEEKKDK